ncbi:5'/3'-nucleotidase SurE [Microbacterium hydrocarbonoxydans]|uniref:5'/3'-nucleotidase SurE n=1 Tax=Microbacterium hydrocarbonoxydans TaxID=273678 RepID=UPI00082B5C7D|nr:5'/3'-nucleotidase SurE [Microbacterium hydrocarbonoxydans]
MASFRPLARACAIAAAALMSVSLLAGAGLASASPGASQGRPVAATSLEGLRILVTNDDSMRADRPNNSDGLGLYEIRRALCNAGADVVVIAPWQVQSGRGSAVTNSGVLTLGEDPVITNAGEDVSAEYADDCADAPSGGAVFGLCVQDGPCQPTSPSATPADTVKFATRGGLHATVGWEHPDLVVSGINSGLNVASSVSDSGTVGAALAAIEHDIPAVAFSTAGTNDLSSFPLVNYRSTAEWGAQFLIGLRAEGLLMQSEFGLNVNYPNVSQGAEAQPAVWSSVGSQTLAYHSYAVQPNGSYRIVLGLCADVAGEDQASCEEERSDADVTASWFNSTISVTPISWDRTFGYKMGGQQELAQVEKFVEHDAPRP